MEQKGEIKTWNPGKEISREIILEVLIRHRNSMKQARTGELPDATVEQLDDNNRMRNRLRALNLIIAAQREMICISSPIVEVRSEKEFEKHIRKTQQRKKGQEEADSIKFKDFKCDYNKMMNEHKEMLKACEKDIIGAERSRTLKDDFIREEEEWSGKRVRLTGNFYDMLEELEDSYKNIYKIMITNKIVSAGAEEDEELDYKQKEEEAIKRVVAA